MADEPLQVADWQRAIDVRRRVEAEHLEYHNGLSVGCSEDNCFRCRRAGEARRAENICASMAASVLLAQRDALRAELEAARKELAGRNAFIAGLLPDADRSIDVAQQSRREAQHAGEAAQAAQARAEAAEQRAEAAEAELAEVTAQRDETMTKAERALEQRDEALEVLALLPKPDGWAGFSEGFPVVLGLSVGALRKAARLLAAPVGELPGKGSGEGR